METKVNITKVKKAALVLRAINHKLRQDILNLIDSNKELIVTAIIQKFKIEQSVASQHLAILRRANIVKIRKEGRFVYYSVNHEKDEKINNLIEELLK